MRGRAYELYEAGAKRRESRAAGSESRGRQGSVRTAGLLGYRVSPTAFVATATTVALIVDGARMPVYLATQGREIGSLWPMLVVATAGVVVGTAIGIRILPRLRTDTFRRGVAILLATLGIAMLASALSWRII